jgi:hypothetical protein
MTKTPKLRIPEQHVATLNYISLISQDDINSVYEILRKMPSGVTLKKFISEFSNNSNLENPKELAEVIFHIGWLIMDKLETIEQIAEDVSQSFAILYNEQDGKQIDEEQVTILNERLKYILLHCDSLKPTYLAFKTVNESGDLLKESEILTGINLFYEDDFKTKHGIINFRIKIEYKQKEQYLTDFYTLDRNDLNNLKSQIEEALLKEQNIITNSPDINFIDIS